MASVLAKIIEAAVPGQSASLMSIVHVAATLRRSDELGDGRIAGRAVIAQALNMLLFARLVGEVPEAARFVGETSASQPIILDHGAVRTIDGPTGGLPRGYRAVASILEPLGFEVSGEYPLDRLSMTGRSFTHIDAPDDVAQFFVSELHVDRLPLVAQAAAERIFGGSVDPVSPRLARLLDELGTTGRLAISPAAELVRGLLACFGRHHGAPQLADYELLLEHSAECAWISTEGNRFNHATARVPDVEALAQRLKSGGYAMKDHVEVSRGGRVRQTAVKAAVVEREFQDGDRIVTGRVPGAFFEFISRDMVDTADGSRLDLSFDSSNAQGIFKMTAAGLAA